MSVDMEHKVHVWARMPGSNEEIKVPVIFMKDPLQPHRFWRIWSGFKNGMLYLEGENTPFVDLDCLSEEVYDRTFRLRPWMPDYEDLRVYVAELPTDGMYPWGFLPCEN